VVFINQLTITTPGLIAQVTGFLTQERYNYATVFLDHFNDLLYMVLQQTLTGEETLWAKANFEVYARRHSVSITHYHTDNGIFRNKVFQEDVQAQQQTTSNCSVGAHCWMGPTNPTVKYYNSSQLIKN